MTTEEHLVQIDATLTDTETKISVYHENQNAGMEIDGGMSVAHAITRTAAKRPQISRPSTE